MEMQVQNRGPMTTQHYFWWCSDKGRQMNNLDF